VEGDEYDSAYFDKRPKFLHYRPWSAIVTSIEFDHADIYDDLDDYREAFGVFAGQLPPDGLLVLCGDDPGVRDLAGATRSRVRTYGLDTPCNVTAVSLESGPEGQSFDLVLDGVKLARLFLPMSGRHNLLNALAACTIALDEGVPPERLQSGIASFQGLKRRQEIRGIAGDVVVIDDFAHHPTAVRETIRAVRQRWPNRRLVAVFEPRSNSSRRKIFESAYGDAFGEADATFLSAPPMRHNDRADDFINTPALAARVRSGGRPVYLGSNADELLPLLLDFLEPGDVALIMSNGGFGNLHQRLLDALRAPSD
jgi:UDP-N-acetylmuramate: L-alanyl-gamma-D-glutamyl-meso-diaminopimelate ligase